MDVSPHASIQKNPAKPGRDRVYLDFYKLAESPFAITPDPDFLFNAGSHRQAIDKITYAIESRMGFVLLTGEVGTGKTTICRTLLDRLDGRAETVYIINPSVSGNELLAGILEDAHIPLEPGTSKKTLIDHLHRHLLSLDPAKAFVIIIDDAQTMPPETLEDLRLLSNLETDKHKLIQVVLSGQPELLELLADKKLRQLKQRISIHCRLLTLSAAETDAYIAQRLFVAGNQGQLRFTKDATRQIHNAATGIPRLINTICDSALTAGYVKDSPLIDGSHIRLALGELNHLTPAHSRSIAKSIAAKAAVTALFCLTAILVAILATPNTLFNRRILTTEVPAVNNALVKNVTTPDSIPPDTEVPPSSRPETTAPTPTVEAPMLQANAEDELPVAIAIEVEDNAPAKTKSVVTDKAQQTPYAMQLGSFATRERAEQSVSKYQKRGIPAHWQAVNAEQWYRVITGKFENMTTANKYKEKYGLTHALIIKAPLTVRVTPGKTTDGDTDLPDFLSQIGHDCLMETGLSGDKEYYTGLFASAWEASLVAEQVNSGAGGRFVAHVVKR